MQLQLIYSNTPEDTGRKLNVHKTFRRCPGRLPNVLCTFNLRPVSTGTRAFFLSNAFLTQPQCYLTFSLIELQMLLSCCLIHITIIKVRHILYLVYLCPCLGLGLIMSCLCNHAISFSFSATFSLLFPQRYNLIKTIHLLTFIRVSPITFGWLRGWK